MAYSFMDGYCGVVGLIPYVEMFNCLHNAVEVIGYHSGSLPCIQSAYSFFSLFFNKTWYSFDVRTDADNQGNYQFFIFLL